MMFKFVFFFSLNVLDYLKCIWVTYFVAVNNIVYNRNFI